VSRLLHEGARAGLILVVATFGAACDPPPPAPRSPSITPRTTAPPGAIAEMARDTSAERWSIRVTEGVAMALECRDSNGAPCLLGTSSAGDESIASYRKAYGDLDQTVVSGRRSGQAAYLNRALFVVVGRRAGSTALTVQTGLETITVDVTVLPKGS